MKGLFGVVGLLITLAIVGLLVKKQFASAPQLAPVLQQGSADSPDRAGSAPGGTAREQAGQVQQQYKQALEAALQKPRSPPEEK